MELKISSQIKEHHTSSHHNLVFTLNDAHAISITRAPTGNCQIYSIGCVDRLMSFSNWYDILAFCHGKVMKKQLLIDVRKNLGPIIEEKFQGKILMKHEYTNTSYHTAMILYVLSTDDLSNRVREQMVTPKW